MAKVRRVDFNPDEFLAGVIGLTAAQVGVYWIACSLIYSRGGAIPQDDERFRLLRDDPRTVAAALRHLAATGKITTSDDGTMMVSRCRDELERASVRIKDAAAAASKRWGDRGDDAPTGRREGRETTSRGSREEAETVLTGTSVDAERHETADRSGVGVVENQAVTDAAAFSPAVPSLTTNHQPPTTSISSSKPSALMSFADFWKLYPRKVGKLAAERAFKRLQSKMPPAAAVRAAVERYVATKRDDIDYCHPTTWLNQGRWSDGEDTEPSAQREGGAFALTDAAPEWAKRLSAAIGMAAFSQWFSTTSIEINFETDQIEVCSASSFALDRIKRDFERQIITAFDRPASERVKYIFKPRKEKP